MRNHALEGISGKQLWQGTALWIGSAVLFGFAFGMGLPWDVDRRAALIVAIVYALIPASFVIVLRGPSSFRRAARLVPTTASAVGLAAALWAAAYVAALAVHAVAARLGPFPGPADLIEVLRWIGRDMGRLDRADGWTTALVWIRACLLAPVGEELLFRGVLYSWLRTKRGAAFTIGVTAVLFAAIHAGAPTMLLLALAVGVAAGLIRERTGSVTPAVIVHVLQNVVVESAAALSR